MKIDQNQATGKIKLNTKTLRDSINKTGPLIRNGLGEIVGKVPFTGPLLRDAVAATGAVSESERGKIRTFVIIWFGQTISLIGSVLTGFGLGVWAYQHTGSATQYTMIPLVNMLPTILFLPIAGALVDRWDRREMMIVSTIGSGAGTLIMGVLLHFGQLEIWHIYLITIARSLFNTLQIPANSSLPTLLISKKHLGRASGMVQAGQATATVAGPFLAGMLISTIQLEGVILVDISTYVFAIISLALVKVPRPQKSARTGVLLKEAINKVKEGTGLIMREAVNKSSIEAERRNTTTLGKTGVLVREAINGTGVLLRQAVSNVRIDEDNLDDERFNSSDAISGTGCLAREEVGKSKGEKSSLLRESIDGWKFIKERPGLLSMIITFAAFNFVVVLSQVLLTPLVLRTSNPQTLSRIVSFAGLGLLGGSILMSVWGGPKRRMQGAVVAAILSGAGVLLIGTLPITTLIGFGLFGVLSVSPILNGCTQAIWQAKTPPNIQGRVFAARRMIAQSTAPLAIFLAGPLADKVFEPLLARNGPLSDSIGRFIGEGPGRGIGLMFMISGVLAITVIIFSYSSSRMRSVEYEVKDAV